MKNKRVYVEPSVHLTQGPSNDLGMYLWLQSRCKVLFHLDGSPIKLDMELTEFTDDFEFRVGDEVVVYKEYRERINDMNLQYNNSVFYLFEVNGSCLFRDMCYNINTSSQWAESNRFLFSILDESERFNSEHYHISAEYKGIPEWEEQFDVYMEAIRKDPVVDHNRLEMPYSISSRFWVGFTKSQLRYFLEFLYYHSPFFYEIYGAKMAEIANINPKKFSPILNPLVSQYMLTAKESEFTSDKALVEKKDDLIIIKTYMGLILYSQFLRQTGTTIQGLFNHITHDDPAEFKHQVFKGDSVFPIKYIAHRDKVTQTVSNRLCAFAMSSESGPCSWNQILNPFIENFNLEEFREMLPCKFHGTQLVHCKYYDDVKFRNEGKEISNIPCPLVTRSMKNAKAKLERDKNSIGQQFFKLTENMLSDGLSKCYDDEHWTSQLKVHTSHQNLNLNKEIKDIIGELTTVYQDHKKFSETNGKQGSTVMVDSLPELIPFFGQQGDTTALMKGLAIDHLKNTLFDAMERDVRYMINFGGDIYIHNCTQFVQIEGTKFQIKASGRYSIFTSSNISRRGAHIYNALGDHPNIQVTVIVEWTKDRVENRLVDLLATKAVACDYKAMIKLQELIRDMGGRVNYIYFDVSRHVITSAYCASPFFNPTQVEIRDKMISRFRNIFRPDETRSSKLYDQGDNSMVNQVVEDNINGIEYSNLLVYPSRTSDLGTLYEVGYALGMGIPVIQYDEKSDSYTIICTTRPLYIMEGANYLFDCSKKSDAVALGLIDSDDRIKKYNLKVAYTLNGCKDNIMLSVRHRHVELIDGKYQTVERSKDERDQ